MPGVSLTLLVNLEDLLKAQLEEHPGVCSECVPGVSNTAGNAVLFPAGVFIS